MSKYLPNDMNKIIKTFYNFIPESKPIKKPNQVWITDNKNNRYLINTSSIVGQIKQEIYLSKFK